MKWMNEIIPKCFRLENVESMWFHYVRCFMPVGMECNVMEQIQQNKINDARWRKLFSSIKVSNEGMHTINVDIWLIGAAFFARKIPQSREKY